MARAMRMHAPCLLRAATRVSTHSRAGPIGRPSRRALTRLWTRAEGDTRSERPLGSSPTAELVVDAATAERVRSVKNRRVQMASQERARADEELVTARGAMTSATIALKEREESNKNATASVDVVASAEELQDLEVLGAQVTRTTRAFIAAQATVDACIANAPPPDVVEEVDFKEAFNYPASVSPAAGVPPSSQAASGASPIDINTLRKALDAALKDKDKAVKLADKMLWETIYFTLVIIVAGCVLFFRMVLG